MKRVIFVSIFVLSCSVGAFAQTQDESSLFPELDFGIVQTEADSTEALMKEADLLLEEQQDNQDIDESDALIQDSPEESLIQDVPEEDPIQDDRVDASIEMPPVEITEETPETTEEVEEEEEKLIYLALDNIKNRSASIKAVSYCSADFLMYNDMNRNVQEISGTIAIGDQTKDFKFDDVPSKQSVVMSLQIVGTACDSMLDLPNIQVNVCKVERLSEKRCKEKLFFATIPRSQ